MEGLLAVIEACHADGAAGWLEEAFDGAEGACLPGAVWPEEAKDLAGLHGEGDLLDGLEAAVADVQVLHLQDGLVSWRVHGC